MSNPFEDENASYLLLADGGANCSLWPSAIDVPAGWTPCWGPGSRADALVEAERRGGDGGS